MNICHGCAGRFEELSQDALCQACEAARIDASAKAEARAAAEAKAHPERKVAMHFAEQVVRQAKVLMVKPSRGLYALAMDMDLDTMQVREHATQVASLS